MSSREDPLRQYLKSPTRKTLARVARVYHEWVWNCALRVTGNEEDASDVCQDVFLDLLLHPPRAEDLRSARGYFAWRVVGRVQRMRRGEARREAREARAIERAMDSGIGGDLPIEEREAVRDAVARLPDDLRALIELHYGVGLTHQEIAEAVGIPERSVKHRLQQARDRLRRLLPAPAFAPFLRPEIPPLPLQPPPDGLLAEILRVVDMGSALSPIVPGALAGASLLAKGKTAGIIAAAALILISGGFFLLRRGSEWERSTSGTISPIADRVRTPGSLRLRMAFIDPQGRPVPADGIKPRGVGAWHVDAAENVLVLELREEAGGPVGFASSCFEKAEIQCSRGGEADALLVRARPVSDRDWEQLPASLDTPITLRLERFLLRLFGKAVSASDGTPIEQGVIRAQGPAEGPQEAEAQLGDGGSFTFSWPACNDPVELRLRIDGDIFDSQRKFSLPAGGSGLEGSRDVDLGEVAFEVRGSGRPAARAKERGPPMVKVDLTKALLPLLVAPAAMAAWSPGPSLPEPRSDAGIAVGAADEIVVTGGCVREGGGGRPRAQVFVLDRGAAGWRVGPSLAEARAGHAVALDSKGRVFAIGGLGGAAGNTILASVETRDPVTGLWTFVAPLPVPTMAHKAVTAPDGKIWVLGGFRDLMFTAPINEVHIYDPVADAWSPGPSMLTPRGLHGAVVDPEGRIYAIGGAYTNGEVEVFDPAVGEWRSLPPLTQHPQNIGAAAVDPCGFIYVFGGYPYTPAVERYDPRDRVWDSADFLSTSRSNMGAATIRDGTIYVIGGTWEYDPVDTVDTLRVPCLQLEGSQRDWIPVSSSASKGILATSPEPIAGFSFGMRLDGTCGSIRIATMRLGSDTPVARPEYWAVSLYPELRAATAACIYSSDLSQWLPAGGGQEIARIVFSASKEDLGADCEISFAEGIGSPSAPIALLDANGVSHAPAVRPAALRVVEGFRRGESNGDGRVDIGDAVSAILQAFGGGTSLCLDATDIDDDGRLTIQDAIYLLSWLFLSGRAIPEPGPFACGPDPTDDAIDCEAYAACE